MRDSKKTINRSAVRSMKKVMIGAAVFFCMNQILVPSMVSPWSSVYAAEFDMAREKERIQNQIQSIRFLLEEIGEWEKPTQSYAEYQNRIWEYIEDVLVRRIQHMEEQLESGALTKYDADSFDEYFNETSIYAKIELNSRKAAYFLEMTEQESELTERIRREFTFSDSSSYTSIADLKAFYGHTIAPVVADMERAMGDLLEDSQKYFPHIVESYTIEAGDSLEAKDLVVNYNTLPENVRYSFRTEPDTSEEGLSDTEVLVQYADDSIYFKPVLIRINPKEVVPNDTVGGEDVEKDMPNESMRATSSDADKQTGDISEKATSSDADKKEKKSDTQKSTTKKTDTIKRNKQSQKVSRSTTGKSYQMKDGWTKRGNTWYFVKNRSYTKGWVLDNNEWYYLDASGKMQTSWVEYQGKWYYLHANGAMAKSTWIQSSSTKKWYYLKENGMMATNERIGIYQVDASGAWIE